MAQAADFFVSYTSADRTWAEWVAWQLEQAGYRVIVQAWDFEPGDNFVVRMRDALEQADRTLALISAAYLASPYCTDEWTGAFVHDPDGRNSLLQVRIEDCELPRLLRAQIYIDLAHLPREQARARLLAGVKEGRRKPPTEPPFPHNPAGEDGPRFPGQAPELTNLPPRNPDFSGRDRALEELHEQLTAGVATALVQAATVHGLGGVGKTQLALEYAHRHAAEYDVIWWVPAELPAAIPGLLGGLARRLGVPEQTGEAELLAGLWDALRKRDRWLLVYDNAEGHRHLAPYRPPGGGGRVLITSRAPTWDRGTATLPLDVLEREEAVTFLRRRTGSADTYTLAALAEALGDLPLALEQAAAYMDEAHTTADDYLALYQEHHEELLNLGNPLTTEQTVATTWQVALDRLRVIPGAHDLLAMCSFLAPDDIPRALLREHADELPEPLRQTVRQPLMYNRAISALGRYSLVTVTKETLTVHRLVQAVIRASLNPDDQRRWAGTALRLVDAAFPRDSGDVAFWPLVPHAMAVVPHAQNLGVEIGSWDNLWIDAVFAIWEFTGAATVFQEKLEAHDPDALEMVMDLVKTIQMDGDLERARKFYEQALADHRRNPRRYPARRWTRGRQ
jgi:hypothetical protein